MISDKINIKLHSFKVWGYRLVSSIARGDTKSIWANLCILLVLCWIWLNYLTPHLTHFWQTSEGSFSSLSKPNFATKYSLESSRRDLSCLHPFAPVQPQNFIRKEEKRKNSEIFVEILILTPLDFVGISQIIQKMLQNAEKNIRKIRETLPELEFS